MQRNGIWAIAVVCVLDFVLHLAVGLPPWVAMYEVIRTLLLDAEASLWDHPQTRAELRAALWVFRLVLPALAGGAILDLVSRLLPEPLRAPAWLRDHTIVVGAGRLGYRVAQELVRRGEPVVVLNLNEDGDGLRRLRELEGITTLVGDAREVNLLERAGVQQAARLVAVTGSDVVNLSVCLLALDVQEARTLRCWAHVFDGRLDDLPEHVQQEDELKRLSTFSLYRDAARHFGERSCRKQNWDLAVVAGYGRFGRAMVSSLRRLHGQDWPIVILDRAPQPEHVEHATYVRGDLLSNAVLERIKPHLQDAGRVLCVVATDSDAANLAFALRLRESLDVDDITVFTRQFEWPASMRRSASLDSIRPLELWDEAGRAVVDHLLASNRQLGDRPVGNADTM